jgi:hypothetical protein
MNAVRTVAAGPGGEMARSRRPRDMADAVMRALRAYDADREFGATVAAHWRGRFDACAVASKLVERIASA